MYRQLDLSAIASSEPTALIRLSFIGVAGTSAIVAWPSAKLKDSGGAKMIISIARRDVHQGVLGANLSRAWTPIAGAAATSFLVVPSEPFGFVHFSSCSVDGASTIAKS